MKKLLALVLALVMTLSLCTVSNAAYSDAKDVDYKEAVDVMSAVGVFQGADGKFSPKAELTREQAAKLIAYLDLGESVAEALPAVKVFNDVEANRWSAKYVAYCADAGYLAGVGDNNFDPAGKLTGYAFGKMLLCVLGYDAAIEGFTGANWQIAVAKLMQSNDIAKSVDASSSATLTREAAAQYCLNTLKADMVEYDNKGTNITINGATIATGASKAAAVEVANGTAYATKISAAAGGAKETVQLGEKLYDGKLVLNTTTPDAFGRPATTWTFKGEEAYSAAAAPVFSYAGTKKGGEIYTGLDGMKITSASYILNGAAAVAMADINDVVKKDNKATGYGVAGATTDIYDNDGVLTFVIVNYTVDTVTKVNAEKVAANGTVTKRSIVTTAGNFTTEDFAKDDVVLVAKVGGAIKDVKLAESIEGKVTSVKGGKVTINGTSYTDATSSIGVNAEGTFYLNVDGSIVKADAKDTSSNTYAYVYSVNRKTGTNDDGLANTVTVTAYAVLDDGTKASYVLTDAMVTALDVGTDAKANTFNAGNGKVVCYKLKDGKMNTAAQAASWGIVDMAAGVDMTKEAKLGAKYATADTQYIFAKITDKVTVKTVAGYKNVDQTSIAGYVYNKDNKVVTVFVKAEAVALTSDVQYAVLLDNAYVETADDDHSYYAFSAFVDGEEVTLTSKDDATIFSAKSVTAGKVFTFTTKDGYLDTITLKSTTAGTVVKVIDDYVDIGTVKYLTDDAEIYLAEVDDDGVYTLTETTLAKDDVLKYTVVASGDDAGKIDFVLVTRAE